MPQTSTHTRDRRTILGVQTDPPEESLFPPCLGLRKQTPSTSRAQNDAVCLRRMACTRNLRTPAFSQDSPPMPASSHIGNLLVSGFGFTEGFHHSSTVLGQYCRSAICNLQEVAKRDSRAPEGRIGTVYRVHTHSTSGTFMLWRALCPMSPKANSKFRAKRREKIYQPWSGLLFW